jgi:transposase-like protein
VADDDYNDELGGFVVGSRTKRAAAVASVVPTVAKIYLHKFVRELSLEDTFKLADGDYNGKLGGFVVGSRTRRAAAVASVVPTLQKFYLHKFVRELSFEGAFKVADDDFIGGEGGSSF